MENEVKKDVFISYSTKNAELAKLFCNQLEGAGVPCWIAPRDIPSAEKWAAAIPKGIEGTEIFALLVSEASVNSDEVEKEIDLANSLKKTIMPIRMEDVPLRGAFQYHLSNKQWVNALNEDKFARFMDAVTEICKKLNKDATTKGGTVALARQFANGLNMSDKFKEKLTIISSMFSAREAGEGKVQIFFPLHLGATGIDLIIHFDEDKSEMRIYADGASDVDRLRYPFIDLMQGAFKNILPHMKKKQGARRWEFFEIVPSSKLDSPLADIGPEAFVGVFLTSAEIFIDKVMPVVLDYAVYAVKMGVAVDRLEAKLKELFSEDEGWRVGAPEGERLKDFKDEGAIYIYKDKWLKRGEGKGFLSLAVSNDQFLDNIWFGIRKSHGWLQLGEWEERLRNEANILMGETGTPESVWPWWLRADEPWRNSGLKQGKILWDDEKLRQFVDYCCDKFRELKKLEGLLDEACSVLPDLQVRPTSKFPPEAPEVWAGNELYIENRLREIAEKLETRYKESGLSASSRFLGGDFWNDVYLLSKSGNFDAVFAFRVWRMGWRKDIMNLDPPDFETQIIKDFLMRFHACVDLSDEARPVSKDLDSGTLPQWMEQFETFVIERTDVIAPALIALKRHLDSVSELARSVEREISAIDDGWLFRNEASNLEKDAPLMFWHKNWLAVGAEDAELPPVVVRIVPDSPCFDDLKIVLVSTLSDTPALERIAGACDLAFGQGDDSPLNGFWSKPFEEQYRYTGGSKFDKRERLIDGNELKTFLEYIRGIVNKFKEMGTIIETVCRVQNDKSFAVQYDKFIETMATSIRHHFPDRDGWRMNVNAPLGDKWGGIDVFKKTWEAPDGKKGLISFSIEGEDTSFDNLAFGIVKGLEKLELSEDQLLRIKQAATEVCGNGKTSQPWWPYYRYAENEYRYTGAAGKHLVSEEKLDRMCRYFVDVMLKMKEMAPVIDKIVAEFKIQK